jgi:galactonate dehydratase
MTHSRREVLAAAAGTVFASVLLPLRATAIPQLRVTGIEILPVRATSRTVWLIVRLRTDGGLEGLGEASDAFGFANTTAEDTARMRAQLAAFCNLIDGRSPFEIESYRQRGEAMARQGLVAATAFSAIEQALWDLAGKALDVPSHVLLGGKVRNTLPVYANINRATSPRTPDGFAAAAKRAVADGFRAIKAAPWDGFPPPSSPENAVARAVDSGIAAVAAMREAVGAQIAIMVECHSFFDVERAVVRRRAVDTIMPDVKHCGGLLELTRIAAMAADEGVMVAPHNPRR